MRVLVFPGGSQLGLEVNRSLRYCKDIELFCANSNVSNHARYIYRNYIAASNITDENWLRKINEIIGKFKIDFVYPANDDVMMKLSENRDFIQILC